MPETAEIGRIIRKTFSTSATPTFSKPHIIKQNGLVLSGSKNTMFFFVFLMSTATFTKPHMGFIHGKIPALHYIKTHSNRIWAFELVAQLQIYRFVFPRKRFYIIGVINAFYSVLLQAPAQFFICT